MSAKKKVVLLAGAAALYYLWRKRQNANNPEKVQYYQSKNGRIYYRDAKTHQAHWVMPPSGGISIPAEEAKQYSRYRGYDGSVTGLPIANLSPCCKSILRW